MDDDRAASTWDRERAGGREEEREVVSASRGRGVATPERKGQQRSKNEDEDETHAPDKCSSFVYFVGSAFNLRSILGTYFTTPARQSSPALMIAASVRANQPQQRSISEPKHAHYKKINAVDVALLVCLPSFCCSAAKAKPKAHHQCLHQALLWQQYSFEGTSLLPTRTHALTTTSRTMNRRHARATPAR